MQSTCQTCSRSRRQRWRPKRCWSGQTGSLCTMFCPSSSGTVQWGSACKIGYQLNSGIGHLGSCSTRTVPSTAGTVRLGRSGKTTPCACCCSGTDQTGSCSSSARSIFRTTSTTVLLHTHSLCSSWHQSCWRDRLDTSSSIHGHCTLATCRLDKSSTTSGRRTVDSGRQGTSSRSSRSSMAGSAQTGKSSRTDSDARYCSDTVLGCRHSSALRSTGRTTSRRGSRKKWIRCWTSGLTGIVGSSTGPSTGCTTPPCTSSTSYDRSMGCTFLMGTMSSQKSHFQSTDLWGRYGIPHSRTCGCCTTCSGPRGSCSTTSCRSTAHEGSHTCCTSWLQSSKSFLPGSCSSLSSQKHTGTCLMGS